MSGLFEPKCMVLKSSITPMRAGARGLAANFFMTNNRGLAACCLTGNAECC